LRFRPGTNWRRKWHQRRCSSKVRVRRNRATGDWGNGRDVEFDDHQKAKETQEAPVRDEYFDALAGRCFKNKIWRV
jgi:hypothetical protein